MLRICWLQITAGLKLVTFLCLTLSNYAFFQIALILAILLGSVKHWADVRAAPHLAAQGQKTNTVWMHGGTTGCCKHCDPLYLWDLRENVVRNFNDV